MTASTQKLNFMKRGKKVGVEEFFGGLKAKAEGETVHEVIGSQSELITEVWNCLLMAKCSRSPNAQGLRVLTGDQFERDPTICANLCPYQTRHTVNHTIKQTAANFSDPVFEKTVLLITLKNPPANVLFRIFKGYLVISMEMRSVVLFNSSVAHIYPRKKRNTGLEIYLDTGDTSLLDSEAIEPHSVRKFLKSKLYKHCGIVPLPAFQPTKT
jgi:hypothetical protein